MIIDNKTNYTRAYTEVKCLLDYIPQSYMDKLPKKLIDLIKKQSDENYNIIIDTNKSLLEQEFSKKLKIWFQFCTIIIGQQMKKRNN